MYTRLHVLVCMPDNTGDLGGLLLDLDQGITELLDSRKRCSAEGTET